MSKFSFDTISEFDNHISSSIKGYALLYDLIVNLSDFFIKGTPPIDLGCTSGKLVKMLNDKYNCNAIGYDITPHNFIDGADLRQADIGSDSFEITNTSLITCVFTLQFLPYKSRLPLLKKIYNALNKGGGFIICEKETCASGAIQEAFIFSNYQYKEAVFTADQILSKEKDLRPIMLCLSEKENKELLKEAGFKIVEPFFQSLNFKGYLCKK